MAQFAARQQKPLAHCAAPAYFSSMSTIAEMKQAFTRLPQRQKVQFARWLQAKVNDRLSDDEMMAIAAEGARALDKREAAHAKRPAR
ncbi:MAG: hypothetical protein M1608_14590 [Candidatus Omnitrophica bacterium]|nr:hypothetical protein [Candidatus Omnitrophota bacterium]